MIRSKRFFCTSALLLLVLAGLPALCQSSQPLPNAPNPDSDPAFQPTHASHPDTFAHSLRYGVVDPGEKAPPLQARHKMMFWLHEDASLPAWAPAVISTGWSQLLVGDPDYGSDSAAFGERIGAAVIRDTSMRFFSDSLVPTLAHEDPRYYRKTYGSIKERTAYAAERVFINRRDDGSLGFNFAVTMGHLAASALTPTYYPAPSANGRVVMTTWALSLAGAAGGNIFVEFWPDIRDLAFHHHRK